MHSVSVADLASKKRSISGSGLATEEHAGGGFGMEEHSSREECTSSGFGEWRRLGPGYMLFSFLFVFLLIYRGGHLTPR